MVDYQRLLENFLKEKNLANGPKVVLVNKPIPVQLFEFPSGNIEVQVDPFLPPGTFYLMNKEDYDRRFLPDLH